ncbi:reverse transcriptase domain-containing protein [Tanacetum coccineum]
MYSGSRSSLQTDEETHSRTPNTDCTKGKGRTNHVPSRGQGSYQCSLNDQKGRQAIASVLCEPCSTRAKDQLHLHGKIGISLAQRKQTTEKKDMTFNTGRGHRSEEKSPDELMAEPEELPEPWTFFTDGSSCIDGSGAGLILTNPKEVEFTYAMRFRFEATNNEAEYEALISGHRIAEQMGVKNLKSNVDSRLVANQVNGSYVAKESGRNVTPDPLQQLGRNVTPDPFQQLGRNVTPDPFQQLGTLPPIPYVTYAPKSLPVGTYT